MNLKVFRFDVPIDDRVEIMMPQVYGRMLRVEASDRVDDVGLAVWAVVDVDTRPVPRVLHVRGTGHSLGEAKQAGYIGTFNTPLSTSGVLWWHVFDGGEVPPHEVTEETTGSSLNSTFHPKGQRVVRCSTWSDDELCMVEKHGDSVTIRHNKLVQTMTLSQATLLSDCLRSAILETESAGDGDE